MATNVLWVGDLDATMNDQFIRMSLGEAGLNVTSIKLIKNKQTGAPQGYGFIEFRDDGSALKTLHSLNGKAMTGTNPPRRWKLNMAHQGRENPLLPDFAIFIGDLEYAVDDLQLFNFFSARYSSVKSARVVVDEHGESRGYGFVRFAEEIDQQRSLNEMQGVTISNKPIRVSIAAPKNKMGQTAEQLQQQNADNLANYYANYVHYASYYQQWQQTSPYDQAAYYQQYYPGYYPTAQMAPAAAPQMYPAATAEPSQAAAYKLPVAPVDEATALIPHDQKKVDSSMNSARKFLERSRGIDRSYDEVWWKPPAVAGSLY